MQSCYYIEIYLGDCVVEYKFVFPFVEEKQVKALATPIWHEPLQNTRRYSVLWQRHVSPGLRLGDSVNPITYRDVRGHDTSLGTQVITCLRYLRARNNPWCCFTQRACNRIAPRNLKVNQAFFDVMLDQKH